AIASAIAALEPRELAADAIEVHAVAAIVAARGADADLTTGKLFSDDLCDFAYPVVVGVLTDVEHLPADGFLRRNERTIDRLADVLDMDDGSPGTTIAHHGDSLRRPCER